MRFFFLSFLLPILEYFCNEHMFSAVSHLGLFDQVVLKAVILSYGLVVCDLAHRYRFGDLFMI